MRKEIVISDISLVDPEKDSSSASREVIKNLIGNYYFSTNNKNYSWFKNQESDKYDEKKSLIENENELIVEETIEGNKEQVTFKFGMNSWKEENQETLSKIEQNINKVLAKSYFYGLSPNKNKVNPKDPDKLIKEYGEDYYDYNMSLALPLLPRTDNVTSKEIENSLSLNTLASIEPYYNFYNKEYELISDNNSEKILYNFYVLYYYLLENLNDPTKKAFLENNVLPLLRQYSQTFLETILNPANAKDKEIIKKLEDYSSDVVKSAIVILPEALKFINDLDLKKAEQPFGIDIQFPSQPKLAINTAMGNINSFLGLEASLLYYNTAKFPLLFEKGASSTKIFFSNEYDNQKNTDYQKNVKKNAINVPIIPLTDWLKKIDNTIASTEGINNAELVIFSKNEKSKESVFLQKIKKVLLQNKINSIIQDNKRNYLDIVSGVPAYNEVLFFEIKKYPANAEKTLLQSIIIPNTENFDFYKYFDTQVAYDKEYVYEVLAWTLIIGNKYKFYDRTKPIGLKKVYKSIKNNSSSLVKDGVLVGDADKFKWFRIADMFTFLNFNSTYDIKEFLEKNVEYFTGFENFKDVVKVQEINANGNIFKKTTEPNAINFSKLLYKAYQPNYGVNKELNNVLSAADPVGKAKLLINTVAESFAYRFQQLLFNTDKNENPQKSQKYTIGYQVINYKINSTLPNAELPTDIIEVAGNINNKSYNYVSTQSLYGISYIYSILDLFKNAGVLDATFDRNDIKNAFIQYHNNTQGPEAETKLKKFISDYIAKHFSYDPEKLLEDGYNFSFTEPDLKVEPNFGLDKFSTEEFSYPRMRIEKTPKGITSKLQFGVLNETDVILAGLPYLDKTNVRIVSSPPAPPDVLPIPYKNVSNKIKFFLTDSYFTYRDFPIEVISSVDKQNINKLLENEKYKNNDGRITFKGDEPSQGFIAHRLDKKPNKYTDFESGTITAIKNLNGGFEDTIEPNMKYYYTFRAYDSHQMASNPSAVFEIEIVENSGAIYPIIKIINIEEPEIRNKIMSFKEKFKISVNEQHYLQNNEKDGSTLELKGGDFGSLTPSIFEKKFKIRITSKSSKKKIDLNLSFTRNFDTTLIKDIQQQIKEKTKKTKA